MTEFTDEYFINLTMDYDERDDSIYPKWAVWCAKSDDRYYIDGKDHHFYTHVRTDEEIAIERKKREIREMAMMVEVPVNEDGHPTEEWFKYEEYLRELERDDSSILVVKPLSFEEWKKEQQ